MRVLAPDHFRDEGEQSQHGRDRDHIVETVSASYYARAHECGGNRAEP